jgi:hypothetical protein
VIVNIPGAEPLTICCMEPARNLFTRRGWRFSWRDAVPHDEEPAYAVSGAGWLVLVGKFGLAPQMEDSDPAQARPSDASASTGSSTTSTDQPLYSQPRGAKFFRTVAVGWAAVCLTFLVILLVLLFSLHSDDRRRVGAPTPMVAATFHGIGCGRAHKRRRRGWW